MKTSFTTIVVLIALLLIGAGCGGGSVPPPEEIKAILSVPAEVKAGDSFDADGSASYDTAGSIYKYWFSVNDGTPVAAAGASYPISFLSGMEVKITLAVEGPTGYDEAEAYVTVRGAGQPLYPYTAGSGGMYSSTAIVDGNPAIAFYGQTNGKLRYVRALDAKGENWGTQVEVDTSGDMVGQYCSLAVIDGRPAISYFNESDEDLYYVIAADSKGADWSLPPVNVTNNGASNPTGLHTSLASIGGHPAISYYNENQQSLAFAIASDADGDAAADWTTVWADNDPATDTGQFSALAEVDGRPAIAYYDATSDGDLYYIRAEPGAGPTDWNFASASPVQLAGQTAGIDAGKNCSLAVIDGRPAVSFYRNDGLFDGSLRYLRADDTAGSAWTPGNFVEVHDGSVYAGFFSDLAEFDGAPAIGFYDESGPGGSINLAVGLDAAGSSFDLYLEVESSGATLMGAFPSVAIADGQPVVSYFADGDLGFFRLY